jgi:hypothetical protein
MKTNIEKSSMNRWGYGSCVQGKNDTLQNSYDNKFD